MIRGRSGPPDSCGRKAIAVAEQSPWLTVEEARVRARCGRRAIYRAVERGRLRGARINERGDLRFLAEWVDAWLESTSGAVAVA